MATKITVTTLINAPLEKVWDNWTKPEHITNWNFAVEDWQCPKAENDLKVGGKYFARMEAKDGSFGFNFEAIYDVVNVKQELTYTMSDGRRQPLFLKAMEAKVMLLQLLTLKVKTLLKCNNKGGN